MHDDPEIEVQRLRAELADLNGELRAMEIIAEERRERAKRAERHAARWKRAAKVYRGARDVLAKEVIGIVMHEIELGYIESVR